ncbi:serine/threonine-protein kinase [Hyalangium sp.]|uniref:serine/threonine protein kinase n=1 Tax=Hyalangium sp. TaxID=2028555 RepID=UPI002D671DD4|nr:serine/threonine-protein kinase [Hyalangium sp.]HYH99173.1 serine/threonine-protein kinase [Hyalangium sp.]
MSGEEETTVYAHVPVPGTPVGPWLILERLDSGTFGVVFRAQRAGHPEAPPVALKLARNPQDPRFPREAELLRRCEHPCIPGYEDMGVWTGPKGYRYPYVVMVWVEGLTLYDWFREQPRSSREVLCVLAQLAGALATAHARGAVHRDVKGDNIRVTPAGRAVLVDWGSGWFAGAQPLTDTTAPPGTSAYRPPEQKSFTWRFRKDTEARWHSRPSDDLYALGVVLYRMVTGVYLPPCTDGGEPVKREVLAPSAMATVSLELEALTLRLLSEDREARGTAEQLEQDVQGVVETAGPKVDRPILPTLSAVPTEEGACFSEVRNASSDGLQEEELLSDTEPARTPRSNSTREDRHRRPSFHAWLALASAGLVSGLVVALAVLLALPSRQKPEPDPDPASWLATPEELAQFATDGGVAEEALASVEVPGATVPIYALGRSMPKQPYPGQSKPPCDRGQRAINGGCWWALATLTPPCGPKAFEYEDGCYVPFFDSPRQPTSGTP